MAYKEEIALVEKLIQLEKVPTGNPKSLATIMVLTHNWLFADAFAGMLLQKLLDKSQEPLKKFAQRILGREVNYVSNVTLHSCLEVLASKHRVFEVLTHERNTWNEMRSLEQELEKLELS